MRAAIISRNGLGDGLIMMICGYHLKKAGYKTTFIHNYFHHLNNFFPDFIFKRLDHFKTIKSLLLFDIIIIEHYKNPFLEKLIKERERFKNLFVIYPSYTGPIFKDDIICHRKKSMAENIKDATKVILKRDDVTKNIGISLPDNLKYKKFERRVAIHPTSTNKKKNWRKKRFLSLYKNIKNLGFDPVFVIASHERFYPFEKIKTISFKSYGDLASFLFESAFFIGNDSGPAHLASSLNIPSIVIASNRRVMKRWKPDFFPSCLITPNFIPNPKWLRLKDSYWQFFVSTKRVIKKFKDIMRI